MKIAAILIALVVGFAYAAPPEGRGEPDLPDQANPNARRVAIVQLSDDAKVEFLDIEGSIVASASIPKDKPELLEVLNEAEKEAGDNPVRLYEMLAGGAGNSGKVPPGLVKKWKRVQEARQNAPNVPPASPPTEEGDDEDDEGHHNLRGLSFYITTGDWWTDNHCAQFRLSNNDCQCYKWQTGSRLKWIYSQELVTKVYPYSNGGVWHYVKYWKNGAWSTLASHYVNLGYVGWAKGWGPWEYYAGSVDYASGDYYYWSVYAIDYNICNPPPGVWQSW